LRLVQSESPEHPEVRRCTDLLWAQGAVLHYTSQNLAEFWNVCTRPAEKNGLGLSVLETDRHARQIELFFHLLIDGEATHQTWRKIIVDYAVSGVQVHDARLVASMRVHRLERLLTLNLHDFRRYTDILVLSPAEVLATNS